jgi:hypothetical protein
VGSESEVFIQPGIHAPEAKQFCVGSALSNPPFLKHNNLIRIPDRTQPMGHHETRASAQQVRERILNPRLGKRVNRACGLVENQNPRVDQKRTRKAY